MSREESNIQQAVMRWWAMAHKGLGVADNDSLMAFPLQGQRNVVAGARLKREGMRKGTADMFLAVARGEDHGLWIELKKPGGHVSPEQKEFLANRKKAGYAVAVAVGFDQCISVITTYLSNK